MVEEIAISDISGPDNLSPITTNPPSHQGETGGLSFKEYFADSLKEIQQLQTVADDKINKMATGKVTNVSEAMVAIEKANEAFLTLLQVRNKIISAYNLIQSIQV